MHIAILDPSNLQSETFASSLPMALLFQPVTDKERDVDGKVGPNKKVKQFYDRFHGTVDMFPGTSTDKIPGRERGEKTVHNTIVDLYAGPGEARGTRDTKIEDIEKQLTTWHERGQHRLCQGELNYLTSKRSKLVADENGEKPIPAFGSAPVVVSQTLPHPYPPGTKADLWFRQHINREVIHAGGKTERGAKGKFVKAQQLPVDNGV